MHTSLDIAAIERYEAWREEVLMDTGETPTLADYRAKLYLEDLEDRLRSIRDIATRTDEKPDVLLASIYSLATLSAGKVAHGDAT